jgi:hypothetical protein
MVEQILAFVLVAAAASLVLRSVWREVDGLIHPDRAGSCPGCGMCDAARKTARGKRSAPEVKVTPLVRLDPKVKRK